MNELVTDLLVAYDNKYQTMLELYIDYRGVVMAVIRDRGVEMYSYAYTTQQLMIDDLWKAVYDDTGQLHKYSQDYDGE
jgi:hypothetical protein